MNECGVEDLSQLRLRLIKRTAENIMNAVHVRDERGRPDDCTEFFLTTKTIDNSKTNVLCGVVIDAATGSKATDMTSEYYYSIRLNDMRVMSEQKYWQTDNDQLLNDLADASVSMALLEVNPKHVVSLNMDSSLNESRGTMSKGAPFVLYNCARLISIRKKFNKKCEEGVYPEKPDLEDVDFGLLKQDEEWLILFNFLLEYPTMIRKIAEDLCKGSFNTHHICRFLFNLSSLFSAYYRRVRVLMEAREHLMPLIFARMALLRATEQVMRNALTLLNIKVVEEM